MKINHTIVDRGARISVAGSSHAGGRPDHHDVGYEQGPYGTNPNAPQAPLTLEDMGRGPWPLGRGTTRVKLAPPPAPAAPVMIEHWRPAPGLPGYQVSSLGRVRNSRGYVLKTKLHASGHCLITLYLSGRRHTIRLHRVICEAFHGPAPLRKPLALHRDDNPENNQPENLYWGTKKDNARDAIRNGRQVRGERHGMARLSDADRRAVRALALSGDMTTKEIAELYGVTSRRVCQLKSGPVPVRSRTPRTPVPYLPLDECHSNFQPGVRGRLPIQEMARG